MLKDTWISKKDYKKFIQNKKRIKKGIIFALKSLIKY
jgi:hypothetical protein